MFILIGKYILGVMTGGSVTGGKAHVGAGVLSRTGFLERGALLGLGVLLGLEVLGALVGLKTGLSVGQP